MDHREMFDYWVQEYMERGQGQTFTGWLANRGDASDLLAMIYHTAPSTDWQRVVDLGTSLTIDNVLQSDVGKALDALRDAGFDIEINISNTTETGA